VLWFSSAFAFEPQATGIHTLSCVSSTEQGLVHTFSMLSLGLWLLFGTIFGLVLILVVLWSISRLSLWGRLISSI